MGCCNRTLGNSGFTNRQSLLAPMVGIIVVPLKKEDGTDNYILNTDTLNTAYFTALLNQVDPLARFYPIQGLKNMEGERPESIKQEFNDGSKFKVRNAIRNQSAIGPNHGAQYLAKMESYSCFDFGIYIIDDCEAITGSNRGVENPTKVYPIRIESGSWDPRLILPTDSTIEQIQYMWDWHRSEKDSYLETISCDEMVDVLPSTLNGLYDVFVTIGSGAIAPTTTVITIDLFLDMGGFNDRVPVEGLLITNFFDAVGGANSKVYNITDSAAVTLTSVVESSTVPGRYTITMNAAQTSADEIRITIDKDGFDFTRVSEEANYVPIP